MISGVSSKPPNAFGRPAFGYALVKTGARPDSSSTYGRISFAPSAQLIPTESSGTCAIEFQNASTIWPESVRPDLSVIVTETMSGTRRAPSSKSCCAAKSAALRTSVSKTVSKRRTSAPPSRSPRTCSR